MNKKQEIKNRIDLINKGEVPEGYKKYHGFVHPIDWKHISFNQIFKERCIKVSDTSKYPLYSLTIENGVIPKTEQYERSFLITKDEDSYKVVKHNDFVYNPMNLRFGAIARYKDQEDCSVSGYYNVFSIINSYNPYFMESFVKSQAMLNYYNTQATGSLIEKQRVHFSQFIEFNFALPSEKEQKKIAEILSCCDKAIELKEKLLNERHKEKSYILNNLLQNFQKEKIVKLIDIADVITKGTTPSSFDISGEIKYIKIESIINNVIDNDKCMHITKKINDKELARSVLKENDILFGIAGALGTCAIVKKINLPANTNQALAIIRINSKFADINFINLVLCSKLMKKYIYLNNTGGAQPNLNLEQISNFKLPLPILNKQIEASRILDLINRKISLLNEELEQYKQLKKALSQLLLTGIVRVNEV